MLFYPCIINNRTGKITEKVGKAMSFEDAENVLITRFPSKWRNCEAIPQPVNHPYFSRDTRESIRVYPESVYPVERWLFCVNVENEIPHWHNGGKSKDEAIEKATKLLGYPPKSVTVENGRVFF